MSSEKQGMHNSKQKNEVSLSRVEKTVDEREEIEEQVKCISNQFQAMGMINSCIVDARKYRTFTNEEIMKTFLDVFSDSELNSMHQEDSYNIVNYLVNYIYQKLDSKTLTSQFCWTLLDQIAIDAPYKFEFRIFIFLLKQNNPQSISFFLKIRHKLFSFYVRQNAKREDSPQDSEQQDNRVEKQNVNSIQSRSMIKVRSPSSDKKHTSIVKDRSEYDLFEDYFLLIEQWMGINQDMFPNISTSESLQYFLNNQKGQSNDSKYMGMSFSEYMYLAVKFKEALQYKNEIYDQQMANYNQEKIFSHWKKDKQNKSEQKSKFGKSFYRWGWPYFSKEDFEQDFLLSQQRKMNQRNIMNKSQAIKNGNYKKVDTSLSHKNTPHRSISPSRLKQHEQSTIKAQYSPKKESLKFNKTPPQNRGNIQDMDQNRPMTDQKNAKQIVSYFLNNKQVPSSVKPSMTDYRKN